MRERICYSGLKLKKPAMRMVGSGEVTRANERERKHDHQQGRSRSATFKLAIRLKKGAKQDQGRIL